MRYSYKKGSSNNVKGGSNETKYYQSIYSSKILRTIFNDKLVINIDECSF